MKSETTRSGSLKAFFEWNYLKLKNYTRSQLGGSSYDADAEDILQDVAVSLFSRYDFDSSIGNFAAYVYRALKNRVTDYRRKKKNEIPVAEFTDDSGNDLFMMIPDDAPVELIMEGMQEEQVPDLEFALSFLSDEERELITENSIRGRTFAELSEEWGISQGTLLSRKHRALNKLHKILNGINNVKDE